MLIELQYCITILERLQRYSYVTGFHLQLHSMYVSVYSRTFIVTPYVALIAFQHSLKWQIFMVTKFNYKRRNPVSSPENIERF